MRRYLIQTLAPLFAASALVAGCGDLTTEPAAGSPARRAALSTAGGTGPKLLECPSAAPAQQGKALIGVLGGTVAAGGTRMVAPAGAVLRLTPFEVVVPQSQYMEVDVHATGLLSFLFKRPVSITIDYSRCAPDALPAGATPRAVYIDGETKQILEDMGGVVDRAARTITFSTGHLSGYAVAY